jgi:hypothetical protein
MTRNGGSHRLDLTYRAGWFAWGERLARCSPRGFLRFLGAAWGTLFAWTQPSKVAVVRQNLALLGQTPPPDANRVYAEFGRVLADYFYAGARPLAAALALVDEHRGFEHFQAARADGRGALLLTPHLSFFELGSAVMHEQGFPMVALTNPEPSSELTAWRAAYRLRWGVETLEVGAEAEAGQLQFIEIVKQLRAGKFVAALFDRPHASQSFCRARAASCCSLSWRNARSFRLPSWPNRIAGTAWKRSHPSRSSGAAPPRKPCNITRRSWSMPCCRSSPRTRNSGSSSRRCRRPLRRKHRRFSSSIPRNSPCRRRPRFRA